MIEQLVSLPLSQMSAEFSETSFLLGGDDQSNAVRASHGTIPRMSDKSREEKGRESSVNRRSHARAHTHTHTHTVTHAHTHTHTRTHRSLSTKCIYMYNYIL